jgi:hypothetical protein
VAEAAFPKGVREPDLRLCTAERKSQLGLPRVQARAISPLTPAAHAGGLVNLATGRPA